MSSRLSCATRAVDGGHLVLVAGELDASTASRLEEVLGQFANGSVSIDLAEVTFCDSSGLRVIIEARERARRRSGTFAVLRASPFVERVLEIAGLGDLVRLADA